MTFETPEDILEHFGVKGMRWGVRNDRSGGSESAADKSVRRKKTAKKIAIAGGIVAVAAGAVVATHILKSKGAVPISAKPDMARLANSGFAWRKDNGPWNYSLPLTPGPGATVYRYGKTNSDPEGLKSFILRNRSLIKSANKDMKSWYERSQTPIPQREYLPED